METVSPPDLRSNRKKGVTGFSLIELLITMAVISILAGIAVPRLRGAIVKAQAAEVLGEMDVVKVAVLTYQSDHHAWPPEAGPGQVPAGLEEYLPEGFNFNAETYDLDYSNPSTSGQSLFNVGITVHTDDERLGFAIVDLVGFNIWHDSGNRFTMIID